YARDEEQTADKDPEGHRQGQCRPGDGPMKQPPIGPIDQPAQTAKEKIAFGVFVRTENAAGKKGNDGQGNEKGSEYSGHDSSGQAANEVTGGFRQEHQGKEGEDKRG